MTTTEAMRREARTLAASRPDVIQLWDRDRTRAELRQLAEHIAEAGGRTGLVAELVPLMCPEWVPNVIETFDSLVEAVREYAEWDENPLDYCDGHGLSRRDNVEVGLRLEARVERTLTTLVSGAS